MSSTAIFDSTRVPAGWALSNSDKTVTNVSAGNDSKAFCPCSFRIASEEQDKIIYWELVTNRSLSGNMDGYQGVVPFGFRDDYDLGLNPIDSSFFPSWGWRGNRDVYRNGSRVNRLRFDLSYNSKRLRIAWQPSSGNLWCGIGSTWENSRVPPANPFSPMRVFTGFTNFNLGTIYAQCRDEGDEITILSNTSEFVDGLPSGCVALDDVLDYEPGNLAILKKTTSYLVQQADYLQRGNVRKAVAYLVQQGPAVVSGAGKVGKAVSYLVQQLPFLRGIGQKDPEKKPTYNTQGDRPFIEFSAGDSLDLYNRIPPTPDVITFWKDPNGKVWARKFPPSGVAVQSYPVIENDFEQAIILTDSPRAKSFFPSIEKALEAKSESH